MALKGLIATPGEAAIGRLAREYRIDPDVHRRLIEEIDSAVLAEREACATIVHDRLGVDGYGVAKLIRSRS